MKTVSIPCPECDAVFPSSKDFEKHPCAEQPIRLKDAASFTLAIVLAVKESLVNDIRNLGPNATLAQLCNHLDIEVKAMQSWAAQQATPGNSTKPLQ